jgi:hypothetical protein
MKLCRASVLLALATATVAAEPAASPSEAASPHLKEVVRREIRYRPAPAPAASPVVAEPKPVETNVLIMPVMRVNELPEKKYRALLEAFAQQRRLDPGALAHSDPSRKVLTSAFLPTRLEPVAYGGNRALFPMLNFSW